MNLRKLTLLLSLPLLTCIARAQLGVFANFQGNRIGGFICNAQLPATLPAQPCGSDSNSMTLFGGGVGAYYDFFNLGPVRLGAELRTTVFSGSKSASRYYSSNYRLYSTLGGVRASFNTPIRLVKPYVVGSVGVARTNLYRTNPYVQPAADYNDPAKRTTNLQYQGFAGVDLRLLPYLDFRLIELGVGGLAGSFPQDGNHFLKSIGTGVVFRLPF